ncbi:MAG: M28 family peptidase [Candidatus Muiribacteriota bacterium]
MRWIINILKNSFFKFPPIKRLLITTISTILIAYIFFNGIYGFRISKVYNPTGNYHEIEKNLEKHVRMLSDEIGIRHIYKYDNLILSQNYIKDEFLKHGYEVIFQTYIVENPSLRKNECEVSNVIAYKDNFFEDNSKKYIFIGAHYDTVFESQGADDNASAVAGMLELARLFKDFESENFGIVFVGFVNEEAPFFQTDKMGSFVFTEELKRKNVNVHGAVILEMIGYYDNSMFSQVYPAFLGLKYANRGNFIAFVGNDNSKIFTQKIYERFKKYSKFPAEKLITKGFVRYTDFSDHWSFWQQDYPAFMLTDTAFLRNKNYHEETDTWDTLKYDWMADLITGLHKSIESFLSE